MGGNSWAAARAATVPVPIDDRTTRMVLVNHVVGWLESRDVSELTVPSDLVDRLRQLSVSDALRLAGGPCGMTIALDCGEMRHQLARIENQRDERAQFEAFIRAGASPALIARLFGVSEIQVRQRRKVISPERLMGGRPRLPDETDRENVRALWAKLLADTTASERERYQRLHQAFKEFPLAGLEDVIAGEGAKNDGDYRRRLAAA